MNATPSYVVMWLQYAATSFGYWSRRCMVCRTWHWIRTEPPVCRPCRANPDAARDAVTLTIYRHLNQRRRR